MSVPRHLAIIMDGNRRWAKKRFLPISEGHRRGAKTAEHIAEYCKDIGISTLTLYAFSTENIKRPPHEIHEIMDLLRYYLKHIPERMAKYNGAVYFIGDRHLLPEDICTLMAAAERSSPTNPDIHVNLALCYGARDEILRAARKVFSQADCYQDITENCISSVLDTADKGADPDLLIRTGGEKRLSNFLLWQCAYAELHFTDTLWPDFDKHTLDAALSDYNQRSRRYGL